jgi:hypothetical protein
MTELIWLKYQHAAIHISEVQTVLIQVLEDLKNTGRRRQEIKE